MTTTKQYDKLDRLTSISSLNPQLSTLSSFSYGYNAANQRTTRTDGDGPHWNFGYDSLGQVTNADKFWQNGTPVPGEQFGYAFDTIGNRTGTTSGTNSNGSLRSAAFSVNDLNQYTSRTVPNAFDVLGIANVAATVTVNGNGVDYQRGEFYHKLFNATNSGAPVWVTVTNTATYSGSSSNVTGSWFIPKTPENFTFDLDGNLTSDGRFTNYWDAENRLLTVSNIASIPSSGQYLVQFAYDYLGRRIQKIVSTNNGSTNFVPSYTNKFIWDGWNVVAVLNGNSLQYSFTWGSDLSGSLQGAGGVGGLISTTVWSGPNQGTYFYCYDGNGNVMAMVNATSGVVAAQYEYGPFGELLRATGPMAFTNPFRFSTKYQDDETGLLYYGYRFYNPSTGTWNGSGSCPSGQTVTFAQVGWGGFSIWGINKPFVDNGSKSGPPVPSTHCLETSSPPNGGYTGFFDDTPSWQAGPVQFVTCLLCVQPCCRNGLVGAKGPSYSVIGHHVAKVGPCKRWRNGQSGDLSTFPDANPADMAIFMNTVSAEFPNWQTKCYSCSGSKRR